MRILHFLLWKPHAVAFLFPKNDLIVTECLSLEICIWSAIWTGCDKIHTHTYARICIKCTFRAYTTHALYHCGANDKRKKCFDKINDLVDVKWALHIYKITHIHLTNIHVIIKYIIRKKLLMKVETSSCCHYRCRSITAVTATATILLLFFLLFCLFVLVF